MDQEWEKNIKKVCRQEDKTDSTDQRTVMSLRVTDHKPELAQGCF